MASWTNQSTASLLPGEPWTSAKALAAFENPEAIAEGAVGAPVNQAHWHPYNMTNVGDGSNGRYYNNTSLVEVDVPFGSIVNGYEYRILGRGIDGPVSATPFRVEYLIGGVWETMYVSTSTAQGPMDFDLWIMSPRRSSRRFTMMYSIAFASSSSSWSSTNGDQETGFATIADNNAAVVDRVRFSFDAVNTTSGEAFLLRRRNLT